MKRCPECRRDYYDDSLLYCLDDGFELLEGPQSIEVGSARASGMHTSAADAATLILGGPSHRQVDPGNSIAVLPFTNISNDPDNEYFCDGLAEELLSAFAKIDDLRVAARTSSFAFKNRKIEVGLIAEALNVKTVLEGSVRKSGDRLRITAQLVNAANGYNLWSETYDRMLADVFEVQDEITRAIVDALKVKLLGVQLRSRRAENIAAYESYLKGKYHLAKLTPEDLRKSIEYFQGAIEMDDTYAKAYVALSDAYMRIAIAGELPPADFFPFSKAAAQRAIEIDERFAQAHVALGWIAFWYGSNWDAAAAHCRRALELDPNDPDAHLAYAHLLSTRCSHDKALAEIAIAKRLDPLSIFNGAMEGQFLLHAGRIDQAIDALSELRALEPRFWLTHLFLASAFIERGQFDDALAAADIASQLSGGSMNAIAFKAYALAGGGSLAELAELVESVQQQAEQRYVPSYHVAQVHHAAGNIGRVFEWLERGLSERDVKMVFLKVEPKWSDLRSDPRFERIVTLIGTRDITNDNA